MASSDDMHYDVFKQATGWLNAGTFCKHMNGQGAVLSISQGPNYPTSAIYPDDVYGESYELFPNFMLPGTDDTETVPTTNMGDEDANVDISSQLLIKPDSDAFNVIMRGPNHKLVDITEYVPDGTPGQHSPFARRFLEGLRGYGGRRPSRTRAPRSLSVDAKPPRGPPI